MKKRILLFLVATILATGVVSADEVNANAEGDTTASNNRVEVSASAKAEVNVDLKKKIEALKKEKEELVAKVKAGVISKEEAKKV